MNQLWSPWRMKYITDHQKSSDCFFCRSINEEDGPENLIVHRGQYSFVILNLFPYTNGHLMVVPYIHMPSLEDLDTPTRSEMMEFTTQAMKVLRSLYHPDAFNLGANIGEAAGAGVADHVHIHVVPRWSGDTNFMSTVGSTRVLPEELAQTYQRVRERWTKV
ncbi:MAG TPA: HIT domain-containing protein [Anaerolineaceae bacterium]